MAESLLHYRPWIGDEYPNGFRSGLKLLILGHSHYADDEPDATEKWTRKHLQDKPGEFWTHIEHVISGRPLDNDQRRAFWNKVAFSNFIQEPLQEPGDKPTDMQWARARRALPEIITHTKPDLMFVFSIQAWSKLPDTAEYPESCYVPGCEGNAYFYRIHSTYGLFAGVFAHPRNPRVARVIWHAWSEFLFTKALPLIKRINLPPPKA